MTGGVPAARAARLPPPHEDFTRRDYGITL